MPRPLDVLYRDEDFLVVNKPAGVPVHGGAGVSKPTVGQRMPGWSLVHRLDADTSGALLMARSAEAVSRAANDWARARKRYIALVHGRVETQSIDAPLSSKDGRRQAARSEIEALATSPDECCTLVGVEIATGRFHQIRRHLAQIGHAVVMDDRHGDFRGNKSLRKRMRVEGAPSPKYTMLHARILEWSGRFVVAPLPERWWAWLSALGIEFPLGEADQRLDRTTGSGEHRGP